MQPYAEPAGGLVSIAEASAPEGLGLLTFEEAAAFLGKSFTVRWIRRHVYEGRKDERIPTRRIGNRRLIQRDALVEWFEAQSRREEVKAREAADHRRKFARD